MAASVFGMNNNRSLSTSNEHRAQWHRVCSLDDLKLIKLHDADVCLVFFLVFYVHEKEKEKEKKRERERKIKMTIST